MKMFCRRIWSMKDVNAIVEGIKEGIEEKVFTDIELMEILRLISSKNVTFYIFGVKYEMVGKLKALSKSRVVMMGFAAVRNNREVYKVFVNKTCRRRGFGVRISLWIKALILKKGYVPICWIKADNEHWNNAMGKQGMVEMADSFGVTNKYMLRDFGSYVDAIKKYKIEEITYIKKGI